MTGSAHDRPGRTARLMLLLATLFGLAAMHTLGHHGPHLTLGHHDGHQAAMAQDTASAAGVVMRAAACDSCAVLAAPMRGDDGPNGWDICVAILVAFAVLLLAATLLRGRRAETTPRRSFRSGLVWPRGPPARRVGLAIAAVSVLRR